MKVGFDVSDLCTSRADGTTRYTRELAKRLPKLSDDEWKLFAPCHPYGSPWPKYWTQSRLPWDLHRHRPDVMFMPIQQLPYLRPRGMKTVAVVHDLAFHVYPEKFTYKDWALQHMFTAYVAREADTLIAVSQSTADDIAKYYGRESDVQVVHHGVDHEKFSPGAGRGEYILYVGQIQPRKNLVRLVKAFESLARRDSELRLVIAGGHGWLNSSIYRYIEQSPVRQKIQVQGAVSDDELVRLYQNAKVFVLPSLYEGFGMPILEAMACGAPVVTSKVSSMPEIAGEAAVLVDPKSVDAIAGGIVEAMRRGDELREKVLVRAQEFGWDKTAKETLACLTSL